MALTRIPYPTTSFASGLGQSDDPCLGNRVGYEIGSTLFARNG